ncbi:MAG: tRNA (adenosine(37)-N6)-threonylcarbamoyltransferase complex dimerization subunit type 1 TsaB [bacterium]|nr:tRNA (adenosine(37)-N6)-threonylcarbamoyltransferase complex dimerization subunit type 1 TsaB [bacterium]
MTAGYILTLDTTSKTTSIAVAKNETILAEYNFTALEGLSSSLIPAVQWVLNGTGLKLEEIDAFGITTGPGLFTGIRVGLAALKGLLLGCPKPIVPVVSLKAIAQKFVPLNPSAILIPLIDARREELYFSGYNYSESENDLQECFPPQLSNIKKLKECIGEKTGQFRDISFTGSGADAYKDLLLESFPNANILNRSPFLAAEVALLTCKELEKGNSINNLQELMPLYIRKPDAEQNRIARETKLTHPKSTT